MSQTDASGERTDDAAGSEAAGVDRRQAAIVALCLLGLVVAAFVAPISPDRGGLGGAGPGSGQGSDGGDGSGGSEGSGSDGGAGDGESGENGGGEGGASDGSGGSSGDGSSGGAEGAAGNGSGDGGSGDGAGGDGKVITDDGRPIPVPGDGEPPTERGCAVVVIDEPVPGDTVALRVYNNLEPVAGIQVWFNDKYVGRTDGTGRVAGRVPYTRDLNVTVRVPSEECEFFRRPYDTETESAGALDRPAFDAAAIGAGQQDQLERQNTSSTLVLDRSTPDDQKDTAPYEVHGSVNLSVVGKPYPGETITLFASIQEVPMRHATVRVDGERVGETTETGRYGLEVPEDPDQFSVTAERGDFSGSRTVDVWHLSVDVVPREGLPFPGEPALVTASAGPKPTRNATATLDGRRLGTTGPNGTVGFSLPADPGGEVTVRTDRQRARTTLSATYASTVVLSALLLVAGAVAVGVTARARGRGAAKRVGAWWLGLVVLFVGLVVGEGFGLLVSLGFVLIGAAVLNRETVESGGTSVAELFRDSVAFVRRTALAVADWTARALDRLWEFLSRIAARIRGLPLSIRGLARRFWGWLRGIPGRIVGTLTASLSRRRVLLAAGILAFLGGLTYRFGALGFLVATLVLFLGFLGYRWWTRTSAGDESSANDGAVAPAANPRSAANGDESPRRRTLRAIWRRFARWVRPHDWRQSTPGEVSRSAIDRGIPERPVRTLTDAFREVEYGGRSPSDRSEAAQEAFDSIERDREGEDS